MSGTFCEEHDPTRDFFAGCNADLEDRPLDQTGNITAKELRDHLRGIR